MTVRQSRFCDGISKFFAVLGDTKEHAIERINSFFAWWASIVYDHPYYFIIGTLVFVALTSIGFVPGIPVWIDGAEPLYSLPFSTARSQGAVHQVLFNETSTRPSFVLVTGKTPGENIFTWKHLEAVQQLDRLIRGQTVDPKHKRRIGIPYREEYGVNIEEKRTSRIKPKPDVSLNGSLGSSLEVNEQAPEAAANLISLLNNAHSRNPEDDRGDAGYDILTFQDICSRNPFGDCMVSGIHETAVFDLKRTLFKADDSPKLFLFDGLAFNAKKKAFPPHFLLGRATEVPCSPELPYEILSLFYTDDKLVPASPRMARANMSCITRVEAYQLIYEIPNRDVYLKRNEAWEKVLVDVLADNQDFDSLRITMNAFRSRDDALRASTSESSDVLFVGLTFAFLVSYASCLNFSCDLFRSKTYPALAGVGAAILGMIAGMGTMALFGIEFVPTALVCPFLVVGVGTDDIFVIINGYSLAYMVDSARDRCILALKDTGLAITITTLTSLISFIIGLNTGYLSIKNFCWFCGAGMFYGYIFVLTFFFAFQCLDAKREEENMACLFCVPTNERREARREELRSEGVIFHKEADISTFTLGALMVRRCEQDALRRYAIRIREKKLKLAEENAVNKTELPDGCSDTQDTHVILTAKLGEVPGQHGTKLQRKKKWWQKIFFYRTFVWVYTCLNVASDNLLSRICLEAHNIGKERGLPPDPSNGVLEFLSDKEKSAAGNPLVDIINHPVIPLYYHSIITGERKLFINEPKGSVGLKWRQFLICYYGPFLVHPVVKVCVFVLFALFFSAGLYGCTQLESGLDLKDLAPKGSYLNQFDLTQEHFFSEYDFPVDIFFPEFQDWWNVETQQKMRALETRMKMSGSGKLVINPVLRMLEDSELKPGLQSGSREIFERTLYSALSLEGGKYKQFEQNFVWEGTHLHAWKMQILPSVMKTSAERATWMNQIREDCEKQLEPPKPIIVMAYNYMMTFYESDLKINSSVTSNMIVAAITMLLVAMVGIPQLKAGLIVILIMGMIDVDIIGFMHFWSVKLNMVSMICLLIAVGFCVDFSAHVCHTFMDAEGETRNQRAIECLVLMGNPVFHGAASSILGVLMLGFSSSYIFRVFFKMMTMVMVFALMHSVIFLPVLLSIVGDKRPVNRRRIESKPLSAKPKTNSSTTSSNMSSSEVGPAKGRNLVLALPSAESPATTDSMGPDEKLSLPMISPFYRERRNRGHSHIHRGRDRPVTSTLTEASLIERARRSIPRVRSANSPTVSGHKIRGFTSYGSPRVHNTRSSRLPVLSQPPLAISPDDDDSSMISRWRNEQSCDQQLKPHRILHRVIVVEDNKAAMFSDGHLRHASTSSSSKYPNRGDLYNQRPRTSKSSRTCRALGWSSPQHYKSRHYLRSPSQDADWFDEDCRIELASVASVEKPKNERCTTPTHHIMERKDATTSELISPERRRRSPITRRNRHHNTTPPLSGETIPVVTGGYESRGYESRGYESRGYESRRYESRRYESRRYESRSP